MLLELALVGVSVNPADLNAFCRLYVAHNSFRAGRSGGTEFDPLMRRWRTPFLVSWDVLWEKEHFNAYRKTSTVGCDLYSIKERSY